MATGKRFYWIKLTKEFMIEDIDFLMNQKNGAKYVVLYQMLCLATINTEGTCAYTVGEVIVPYDVDKIRRECRYFDNDTIIVALELFKKLGWVYEQENGVLQIANFEEKVGSETDWAAQKQRQRLARGVDNVHKLSTPMSAEVSTEVSTQRKSIEERDQSKELDTHSITLTAHAGAQGKEADSTETGGELPPEEQKRRLQRTYLGGDLGEGLVMISTEQFDVLCEQLSHEELEKYFKIVVDCEKRGKSWKKKTHYQAILDMVAQDRRV